MRRSKLFVFPALLAVLVMGWATVSGTPVGAAGNPSATGHYDIEDALFLPDHVSFSAIQHKDGTVKGQAEILLEPEGERLHVAIDCMVINGNRADISGIVTQVQVVGTPNPFNEGDRVGFSVVDNGEGNNAPPDEGSPVFFDGCPPITFGTEPSERGNIQVRP